MIVSDPRLLPANKWSVQSFPGFPHTRLTLYSIDLLWGQSPLKQFVYTLVPERRNILVDSAEIRRDQAGRLENLLFCL